MFKCQHFTFIKLMHRFRINLDIMICKLDFAKLHAYQRVLHTNKKDRCTIPCINTLKKNILKVHCSTTCIPVSSIPNRGISPHFPTFLSTREKGGQTLFRSHRDIPSSFLQKIKKKKKKRFPKKPITRLRTEETKIPISRLFELRNFSPPLFESAGFVVMAKRVVSREERSEGDPLWSGTVLYRILSDYAKSLMEITVVSKWREDILTVPRELR